jgi:very-short-patch-repair endonuclease
LLHRELLDLDAMTKLAESQLWRPGANEALWLLDHLDPRCRSLKESETRAILRFAGLADPEVNESVDVGAGARVVADLVYRDYDLLVEYEGMQHQQDRGQYRRDLDRYELLRDHAHRYVQITHEHLKSPRIAVGRVYRALLKAGYEGAPPAFGDRWRLLFLPISVALGPRDRARVA